MLSCGLTTGSYLGGYIVGCMNRRCHGAEKGGEGGGTNPPSHTHPNPQNHPHLIDTPVDPYIPFQYESKASRGLPHLNLSHFLHSLMTGTPLADFITEERPEDGR